MILFDWFMFYHYGGVKSLWTQLTHKVFGSLDDLYYLLLWYSSIETNIGPGMAGYCSKQVSRTPQGRACPCIQKRWLHNSPGKHTRDDPVVKNVGELTLEGMKTTVLMKTQWHG